MSTIADILIRRLEARNVTGNRRNLAVPNGFDFCSNDYLNFACDPLLRLRTEELMKRHPVGMGACGSRLIRGNLEIFEELEQQAASFCGREAALFFPSGYQANVSLLSALLKPEDTVFSDQLNHASIIDGIRLSRASKVIFPHRDVGFLRKRLEETSDSPGLQLIVSETLFSMEGDLAPIRELSELASEFNAGLILDESHATGFWGSPNSLCGYAGSQDIAKSALATVHTGGKALGCSGAWIACDSLLRDYLVNFSRGFIYSTAPSPLMALSLMASFKLCSEIGAARAEKLRTLCQNFRSELTNEARLAPNLTGPIFPVILGSSARAIAVSERLRLRGFDVRAIRPPTVPEGLSRIRITLNAGITPELLSGFMKALNETLAEAA